MNRDDLDTLQHIYLQAAPLAARLDADREQFPAAALADLGLDIDDPEPISAVFATFTADVDLFAAAGDLLVSSEELEGDLGSLDPAVQALGSGELEREDWTVHYLQSLCTFTVALDNTPDESVCDAVLGD